MTITDLRRLCYTYRCKSPLWPTLLRINPRDFFEIVDTADIGEVLIGEDGVPRVMGLPTHEDPNIPAGMVDFVCRIAK